MTKIEWTDVSKKVARKMNKHSEQFLVIETVVTEQKYLDAKAMFHQTCNRVAALERTLNRVRKWMPTVDIERRPDCQMRQEVRVSVSLDERVLHYMSRAHAAKELESMLHCSLAAWVRKL
jgi:hypothetical protein